MSAIGCSALGPIHHVGFVVKAFARAEPYFTHLGYERLGDPVRDEYQQADIIFLKRTGSLAVEPLVELIQPASSESKVYGHAEARLQIHHVCFRVEGMSEAIATLKRGGLVQVQRIAKAPAIGGSLISFVYAQPMGLFELVERPPF